MPKGYDIRTMPIKEAILFRDDPGPLRFFEYCPGNGTRYAMLMTQLGSLSEDARARLGTGPGGVLVTMMNYSNRQSIVVGNGDFLHYGYVKEKLDVSTSDAVVLAEFIGHVLGIKHVSCEDFEAEDW